MHFLKEEDQTVIESFMNINSNRLYLLGYKVLSRCYNIKCIPEWNKHFIKLHEMGIAALLTLHNSFMDFLSQMVASKICVVIRRVCLNMHSLKRNNFTINAQVLYILLNIFLSFHFSYTSHFRYYESSWIGNYHGYKEIALLH